MRAATVGLEKLRQEDLRTAMGNLARPWRTAREAEGGVAPSIVVRRKGHAGRV
jgi:hypothetical protein